FNLISKPYFSNKTTSVADSYTNTSTSLPHLGSFYEFPFRGELGIVKKRSYLCAYLFAACRLHLSHAVRVSSACSRL
ncbi:MAG: hypothetical protein LBL94_00120, partial [Prevotellaceae bacterium]|nr:hypothetical protein [Prevotellaceae bacterium]